MNGFDVAVLLEGDDSNPGLRADYFMATIQQDMVKVLRSELEEVPFDGWHHQTSSLTGAFRRQGGGIYWVNIPFHGKHFTIQRFAHGDAKEFHLRGRALWDPAERLGVSIVPPPKKLAVEGCLCVITYRIYTGGYSLEALSYGTQAVAEAVRLLESCEQVSVDEDEH